MITMIIETKLQIVEKFVYFIISSHSMTRREKKFPGNNIFFRWLGRMECNLLLRISCSKFVHHSVEFRTRTVTKAEKEYVARMLSVERISKDRV